jgi:hypothetical protein
MNEGFAFTAGTGAFICNARVSRMSTQKTARHNPGSDRVGRKRKTGRMARSKRPFLCEGRTSCCHTSDSALVAP